MDSSITQVISERIDQTRPVLFLIGQGKHFGTQQEVHHIVPRPPERPQAGICHFEDVLVGHVAMHFDVQPHQISVYRLRLLPLFEYHYSHLVPHPRAEVISQPSLHAADSEVIYPASQYLVQLYEDGSQRHRRRPFPAQDCLHLLAQLGLSVLCRPRFPSLC